MGSEIVDSAENNCIYGTTPRTPSPFPNPQGGSGLTGETCKFDRDNCKEPRVCFDISVAKPCSELSVGCICFTVLRYCDASTDCEKGERCIKVIGQRLQACLSCKANLVAGQSVVDKAEANCKSENNADEDEVDSTSGSEPCIAIDALSEFSMTDLVYPEHIKSTVLCDSAENCATAGHMVLWNTVPMMMKSYCSLIDEGCKRRVKFVNSPRMKRQLYIQSNSAALLYSALSARYSTVVEERCLRFMIRYVV